MNEVENHYSGTSNHEPDPKSTKSKASNPADVAKAAIEQATSKAKQSLKGAKSTAGSLRDKSGDHYEKVTSWASDQYDGATRRVSDARRRQADTIAQTRDSVQRFVEDNPVMVGVVGLAAGMLLGSLLPGTKRENETFGKYADEVKDQGLRYARDLAEQGKHFVEDSLDTAAGHTEGSGGDQEAGKASQGQG